jgi:hypothetical protein
MAHESRDAFIRHVINIEGLAKIVRLLHVVRELDTSRGGRSSPIPHYAQNSRRVHDRLNVENTISSSRKT